MKILITLICLAAYAILLNLPDPGPSSDPYPTVVIATDSLEVERLSPGGGTEEATTYTYTSSPAYDFMYKKITLDSTSEMVEYNRVHKAKFR